MVKSYADSLKNRSGRQRPQQVAQTQSIPSVTPTRDNPPPPPQPEGGHWVTVGSKPKNKKRLAQSVPYQKGTCTESNGVSIARTKPQYLQNKVLVVSGMPLDINQSKLEAYINPKADRKINLLYVARLDREYSEWATIAIELNDEDYETLAKPDFWQQNVWIRPWKGWRFWRSARRKVLKPQDIKNAARRKWDTGPTS